MRFLYALVMAMIAVGCLKSLDRIGTNPTAMATQPVSDRDRAGPSSAARGPRGAGAGTAYIRLDQYNQFTTDIEIEGQRFRGVIDTGASTVVLRYEDAATLGIFRKGQNWNRTVSTANGNTRAMAIRLNDLSIGDLTVYDVEALALGPGAVSINLIGMSLLRRLSKFEVKPDAIVLQR